jgi:hypothetical protein
MSERVQPQHLVVWEMVAAGACFAVAVIALALGFVFTTHWLLDDHLHPLLHTLGLVLLVSGIPIMMLGAHFMDLQEKKLDESRKNSKSAHVVGLVSVLGVLFIPSAHIRAQQTIFNVPSTDVLDKGKVYVELDASVKPTDGSDVARFSSFVPRVVIGAGSNIEFGLNVTAIFNLDGEDNGGPSWLVTTCLFQCAIAPMTPLTTCTQSQGGTDPVQVRLLT